MIDAIMKDGAMNAAEFGARPMRRASQRLFEDAVSDAIVRGFLQDGDAATVDMGPQEGQGSVMPTVAVKRERDGELLMVEVDDGSGGIGMAVAASSWNAKLQKGELLPESML